MTNHNERQPYFVELRAPKKGELFAAIRRGDVKRPYVCSCIEDFDEASLRAVLVPVGEVVPDERGPARCKCGTDPYTSIFTNKTFQVRCGSGGLTCDYRGPISPTCTEAIDAWDEMMS